MSVNEEFLDTSKPKRECEIDGCSKKYLAKGYCWDKEKQKWMVRYKGKHYGRYKTLEEAKEAYKRAKSGVEFVPATRKLRHLPKGVSRLKTSKNYLAKAQIGGVRYYLGTFRTIEEASEAYNNIIKEKTQ